MTELLHMLLPRAFAEDSKFRVHFGPYLIQVGIKSVGIQNELQVKPITQRTLQVFAVYESAVRVLRAFIQSHKLVRCTLWQRRPCHLL